MDIKNLFSHFCAAPSQDHLSKITKLEGVAKKKGGGGGGGGGGGTVVLFKMGTFVMGGVFM